MSRVHPKTRKGPRMDDAAGSYFAALAALRLIALLTGQRFAEPADEFDLVLAAALMRARA